MAVKYQDYYEILGLERSTKQNEIQSAYRKLARKYHPDLNKNADAEDRFKRINEAYEVLGDPVKRKKYDQLGMNWQMGDDFSPPPGWDFRNATGGRARSNQNGGNGFSFNLKDFGEDGFSDFFDTLFGGFGKSTRRDNSGFTDRFGQRGAAERPQNQGSHHEAELEISLEEAYLGARKTIGLSATEPVPDGGERVSTKSLQVTIPPGVTDGKKLRLPGQGGKSHSGSKPGDLYLTVKIARHPKFTVRERNLEVVVPVTPWEAALGSTVKVPLVSGSVEIPLPAGIDSEKRIRIKGKGLGNDKEGKGDLFARIRIVVPKTLSKREEELFSELAKISDFHP